MIACAFNRLCHQVERKLPRSRRKNSLSMIIEKEKLGRYPCCVVLLSEERERERFEEKNLVVDG